MSIKILIKESEFKSHKMYDPNSDDEVNAGSEEDHVQYAEKDYIHIDPDKLRKIIGPDEGGAAGISAFEDALSDFDKEEIEDALGKMDDIGKHFHGDYVLQDDETEKTKDKILVQIVQEEIIRLFLEKKKKKGKKKKKKDDRCTRIAKRKYDVWPSAYASGAVVKCRDGKIWKNEK